VIGKERNRTSMRPEPIQKKSKSTRLHRKRSTKEIVVMEGKDREVAFLHGGRRREIKQGRKDNEKGETAKHTYTTNNGGETWIHSWREKLKKDLRTTIYIERKKKHEGKREIT